MSKMLNKTLDQRIEEILTRVSWHYGEYDGAKLLSVNQATEEIKALLKEVLATVRPEELHSLELSPAQLPVGIELNIIASFMARGYAEALAEYDDNCREILGD